VLADPDAVEEALEASRAEVNRQVADITERADRDHQLTEAAQGAQASEAAHTEALATRDAETRAALPSGLRHAHDRPPPPSPQAFWSALVLPLCPV